MGLAKREQLLHYFPGLDSGQLDKLLALEDQVKDWNEKINVVSRKDIDNLFERHILHSLTLYKFIQFLPETKILDGGTGGGFPGLPLAIANPESSFHLVDSTRKKLNVVNSIAETLQIDNITTEHNRLEKTKGKFDFALGRAVTNLPRFLAWSMKRVRIGGKNELPNGIFYWKGGELEEDILDNHPDHFIFNLWEHFAIPLFQDKYIIYIPKD